VVCRAVVDLTPAVVAALTTLGATRMIGATSKRAEIMRRLLLMAFLVGMSPVLAGCGVMFASPPTVTQPTGLGALEITVRVCSHGATTPVVCEANDLGTSPVRVWVGLQVPGPMPLPASVTASVTGGATPSLTFERNASLDAKLAAEAPPAAGMKWVGYATPTFTSDLGTAYTGEAKITVPLAGDLPRDVRVQAIAGAQGVQGASHAATDPLPCATDPNPAATCIDQRSPGSATDFVTYRWRSLTLAPGPVVSVPVGGSGTVQVSGTFTGSPFVTPASVAASASVPGAPLTHTGSVALAAEGTFTYPIQVAVPSTATTGPASVTATVTVPGGDTVTTAVPFNVVPAPVPPPAAPQCPTRPRFNSIIFRDGVTSFYYRPLPGQQILGARRFGSRLRVMLRTSQGRSRLPRVEYTTDALVNEARLPWFAKKVGPRRVITAIMANADASKYSGIRLAYRPKRGTYAKLILPNGNVRSLRAECPRVTGYATIYAQNIFVQRTSKQ